MNTFPGILYYNLILLQKMIHQYKRYINININANALCDCFFKTGQLVNKQLTTFYQIIMVIKNNTINVVFVISAFSDLDTKGVFELHDLVFYIYNEAS